MEVLMIKRKQWQALCVYFILAVSFVMVFLTRCTFKSPIAPNWDVTFFIPLINETFTMVDLSEDIHELDIQGQEVFLNYTYSFNPLSLEDQLNTSGASITLSVPSNGSISDSVGLPLNLILVDSAIIKTGSLTLNVTNSHGYTVGVSGPPGTHNLGPYALDGGVLIPPIRGGQNYIRFNVGFSGGLSTDFVDITFDFSDFTLSSVTGILYGLGVSIDDVDTDVDIPEEIDELRVGDAKILLTFGPDIPFPMDVDIFIEAIEKAGGTTTETILIQQTLVPGVSDTIRITNLANFFNSIISQPSRILISGNVSIGDGVTQSTISEDDSITGTAILQAPLIFTLPAYDTDSDPDTLTIDEDTRDIILDNVKNLKLAGEIENHLPIGVKLELLFSKDRGDSTMFDAGYTPDFTATLDIAQAPNDGGNPAVVSASLISPLNISMTEQIIENLFSDSLLYYGIRFTFSGTNSQMVEIRASDFIRIQANFTAEVNTKIPEKEDGKGGGS
jgi:hypothetical protein